MLTLLQIQIFHQYICEDWGANGNSTVYRYDFVHPCPPNAVTKPPPSSPGAVPVTMSTMATTKKSCGKALCPGDVCGKDAAGKSLVVDRCNKCGGTNACTLSDAQRITTTMTLVGALAAVAVNFL